MSEPSKYRDWILETIDSLRSRKARPDLERICRMVRRRHGSDPDRTRTELEKLIQEQTVLKVSYKGSISYRNAAKVQRKSRKKSEFTGGGGSGSGGGAEAAKERTKHEQLNNNGDSAHSFTDQEEGEEDSEPNPEPRAPAAGSSSEKQPKPAPSARSGNGSFSCGATTGCDVGSGWKEEKASASRDKGDKGDKGDQGDRGLGQQGAGGCPDPGLSQGTSAQDANGTTQGRGDAARGGKVPGLSGADTPNKTCCGSVGPRQPAPLKPKLKVIAGGTRTAGNHPNSDLGDRLVASVRSLSERSLKGGSAAATRGHIKPLGLKEILGYLSSQERLSEEKLTRGKVKVVMEREVARGRLRRTRCGNITLPLRGVVLEEQPRNASAHRLVRSALQDAHTEGKKQNEAMETGSEEEERGENEEEERKERKQEEEEDGGGDDDPRSSDEEGGLSSVAMTTEPELIEKSREDAEVQAGSELQGVQQQQQQQHEAKGLDSLSRMPCSVVQGSHISAHLQERDTTSYQLLTDSKMQDGRVDHVSPGFNCLESKAEVGVSSCLLTPTASPRDCGLSDERGMNGGVSGGGLIKSEGTSGSPAEWTVSDVVTYFTEAGFPEQAAAFKTQEIDGKSLLLMQRNDVLTGLSIRLGPALKIYERHVKVLQRTHFEDDEC